MRSLAVALALVVPALALAACNNPARKSEEAAPGSTAPAAPAAAPSLPVGPVNADQLPHRRPGLWEISMSEAAQTTPPHVSQMCIDASTEAKASIWGNQMSRDMCSKYEMNRQADGSYRFSSVCNMGSGGVTRSEGTATGDLTSNYTVRVKSSTSGAAVEFMNRDGDITIVSRRVGACAAGQKGGDVIMNGRVVANVNGLPGPGATPGR
jgi:hypothetical protein